MDWKKFFFGFFRNHARNVLHIGIHRPDRNFWTFLNSLNGGGLNCGTLKAKKFFSIFAKNDPTTPNFMRKIDCAHSRSLKMLPWHWFNEIRVCFFPLKISYFRFNTHSYFPESGSRKHFQASGMRVIDFSPRN